MFSRHACVDDEMKLLLHCGLLAMTRWQDGIYDVYDIKSDLLDSSEIRYLETQPESLQYDEENSIASCALREDRLSFYIVRILRLGF